MKVTNLKRIAAEEFESEMQPTITQLSATLNPFLEQVSNAFNKNIDFDNLNQEVLQFEVTVDASGVPTTALELRYGVKGRPRGMAVIQAFSLSATPAFPTAAPFITYDFNNGNIRVRHVAGLPANKKFQLSVILYG